MVQKNIFEELEENTARLAYVTSRPRAWELVRRQADVNLDRPNYQILKILHEVKSKGATPSQLADALSIEAPSVTRMLKELETEKFIRRVVNRKDRRSAYIFITPQGESTVEKIRQARCELLVEMLEAWTDEDKEVFAKLLKRFVQESVDRTKIKLVVPNNI